MKPNKKDGVDWIDWRVTEIEVPPREKRTYVLHVPSNLSAWAEGFGRAEHLREIIEKNLKQTAKMQRETGNECDWREKRSSSKKMQNRTSMGG